MRLLLVPVTWTWNVPDVEKVHERVELPEPVTPVGDRVQLVLLLDRLTTLGKWLSAVTVMVEVAATFTCAATVEGLAVIVKSWTMTVIALVV